jgi:hypothetical protein
MTDRIAEEIQALKIAARLIDAGVPIFAAAPNPDRPGEYYLPRQWEKTIPSHTWLEKWRPGWALAAVGGHVADFLDFDPRNGGDQSRVELEIQGQMPRSFGTQATPSGGTHEIISPTGIRKSTGFMPGVDLQAGAGDGEGRGFIYIAPTVRPSKAPETLGQLIPYVWIREPDMEYLQEFSAGGDTSLEGILDRVHAARGAGSGTRQEQTTQSGGSQLFSSLAGETRAFTMAEAQEFCIPHLSALEDAQIGEIEERANRAAATLSHFVPSHWDADFAYSVLLTALAKTAYDPSHPASGWTAEKFKPVLDGRRPPLDNWKAEYRAESVDEVTSEPSAVDALLAEMKRPSEIRLQPPPRMLVEKHLTLDSEAWVIGAPGSKKSFVVLDLAAHIAEGRAWQGLKVTQGRVVMIVAEGAGGMGPRLKAWEAQNGRPVSEEIWILPRPVQASNLGAWATLRDACARIGPALVVIDTQARVTVGMEENSSKDMGLYIEAVRSIREVTGACVLSIHHTGRAGGDARGSSAIDGAQTTELKVVSEPGTLKGKLQSEKQKDLQLATDVELTFIVHTVGVDEDGQPITSLAITDNLYEKLAGPAVEDIDFEPWRGQEAGAWTAEHVPANSWVKRRVLQVLMDHARGLGLTKAEVRDIVKERWSAPSRSGWATAWQEVTELDCVVSAGGERWTLDRVELGLSD